RRVLGGRERVGAPAGLGRDERPLGSGDQRLADPHLGAAVAVDVGGVEQGYPGVERGVEDVGRGVVVDVPPVAAELPGAQADDADVGPRPSERSLLHAHGLTVSRTRSNSFSTGTALCSPDRRSRSCPTPSARSRSPMTTACEAPERSAAFIAPLSPRSPYTVSAAMPASRSCPTSRTAIRLASAPSGTTNACTPVVGTMSSPSACTASSVRSTPTA